MPNQSGSDELPKPGWCGAMTRNRAREQVQPRPPRLQAFAGVQEQQRRPVAALLDLQRDAGDGDATAHSMRSASFAR